MFKKLCLAGVSAAFIGATALALPLTAQAGLMGGGGDSMNCSKMAKEQYPSDRKMRKTAKSDCKAHMKSMSKMEKADKKAAS